jgi:hypothetical protein
MIEMFPDPRTTDGHPAERFFTLLELITPPLIDHSVDGGFGVI